MSLILMTVERVIALQEGEIIFLYHQSEEIGLVTGFLEGQKKGLMENSFHRPHKIWVNKCTKIMLKIILPKQSKLLLELTRLTFPLKNTAEPCR